MPPVLPQDLDPGCQCEAALQTGPSDRRALRSPGDKAGSPMAPVLFPLSHAAHFPAGTHRPKVFWIILGILLVLVLAAGVFGTLSNRRGSSQPLHVQGATTPVQQGASPSTAASRPVALVYKDDNGPAGCDGCAEAVAALLQSDPGYHFAVRYVGPDVGLSVQAGLALPGVVLYAQPGGNGTVNTAYAEIQDDVPALLQFVSHGGRFLGFCLGGYLEGTGPGLNLLTQVGGDTDEYITSPGATVTQDINTEIQVLWRGTPRTLFFEDGNFFTFQHGTDGATVLATYTNGEVAAVVAPYGKGKVGGVGPHPEADASWYSAYSLSYPGSTADLGYDLINTTMH